MRFRDSRCKFLFEKTKRDKKKKLKKVIIVIGLVTLSVVHQEGTIDQCAAAKERLGKYMTRSFLNFVNQMTLLPKHRNTISLLVFPALN